MVLLLKKHKYILMRINFKVMFLFASMLTIEPMNFEVLALKETLCALGLEKSCLSTSNNDVNVSVNTLAYV